MPKYNVKKILTATWKNVEAKSTSDAAMKTRKIIPNRQNVQESWITKVKEKS